MKTLTISDIRELGPCYDPTKYLSESWTGDVTDLLRMKEIPAKDRLWVVVRSQFLDLRTLQEFGLGFARMCEKYSTDERVKNCNDTVEAYLNGTATLVQVNAAAYAAHAAAYAAHAATRAAAYAARAAAYAAHAAAYAAADAAADAAYAEVQESQCELLLTILTRVK